MGIDRDFDNLSNKKVFILLGGNNFNCPSGVYSSYSELRKGTEYWMEKFTDQSLAYQEWELDCQDQISWDWCYIAPNSSVKKLMSGGGMVPNKSWWGKNIVGVDWEEVAELDYSD
jgi:hypothetical protein